MDLTSLERRIIDISYKKSLSHIGSCLNAVGVIDYIYSIMDLNRDKFVLSAGHAGLALYTVLEKYYDGVNAEDAFNVHGVHPEVCEDCHIDCSSGSLGQGLPIAVGMALADRSRNVYCVISDGECAEGSIWEALRIRQEHHIENLKVYCILNGWSAYGEINTFRLKTQLELYNVIPVFAFSPKIAEIQGQEAHYKVLTKEEYEKIISRLII